MPSGSHNKIKLNVRVPPSKKEEWKDALEEGETLTSLVRRAVDREIRDEYIPIEAVETVADSSDTDNAEESVAELSERLDGLHQSIAAVSSKIDTLAVTGDTGDGGNEESVEELAANVLGRLPSYPNDIPEYVLKDMEGMGGMEKKEYIETIVEYSHNPNDLDIDGSAQHFAHQLREPEHRIREAMLYLEKETTEGVYSGMVDGIRHWMRF